jgi:hypothetical protein
MMTWLEEASPDCGISLMSLHVTPASLVAGGMVFVHDRGATHTLSRRHLPRCLFHCPKKCLIACKLLYEMHRLRGASLSKFIMTYLH